MVAVLKGKFVEEVAPRAVVPVGEEVPKCSMVFITNCLCCCCCRCKRCKWDDNDDGETEEANEGECDRALPPGVVGEAVVDGPMARLVRLPFLGLVESGRVTFVVLLLGLLGLLMLLLLLFGKKPVKRRGNPCNTNGEILVLVEVEGDDEGAKLGAE